MNWIEKNICYKIIDLMITVILDKIKGGLIKEKL